MQEIFHLKRHFKKDRFRRKNRFLKKKRGEIRNVTRTNSRNTRYILSISRQNENA